MGLRERAERIKNTSRGEADVNRIDAADISLLDEMTDVVDASAPSGLIVDELGEDLSRYSFSDEEDHEDHSLSGGKEIVDEHDFHSVENVAPFEDDFLLPEDNAPASADNLLVSNPSFDSELESFADFSDVENVAVDNVLSEFDQQEHGDFTSVSSPEWQQEGGADQSSESFDDRLMLEISKEIIKASSFEKLKDILLFSVMGHVPVTSACIIVPDSEPGKWFLDEARGIKIKSKKVTFKNSDLIFSRVLEGTVVTIDSSYDRGDSRDEYFKMISIGAKILVPVSVATSVKMVLALGEKITPGNLTDSEKAFIAKIAEITAVAVDNCFENDRLRQENEKLSSAAGKLVDVDTYENNIRRSAVDGDVEKYIRREMSLNGVDAFSFFVKNDYFDRFDVMFSEEKDVLMMKKGEFTISRDNAFTAYLSNLESCAVIDNPVNNEMLHRIFREEMLARMNTFISFPYVIRGRLAGFCLVYRMEPEAVEENLTQVSRLSRVVYSYLHGRKSSQIYTDSFYDASEPVIVRFNDELKKADLLNIPVTVVHFSIKNFRRYQSVYGDEIVKEVIINFREILRARLSETDFTVRIDRGSFIAFFPGKGKKQVLPLANAVKNELVSVYRIREIPLMVTFLAAEYPEDGKDIHSILSLIG